MTRQNIYDDAEFFEGYERLRSEDSGLNSAIDQPALTSLLPDVTGLRVVDLGCGFGTSCRDFALAGASSVVGVDPSERMLEVAQQIDLPAVTFIRGFAEDVAFPTGSVDLVVSSLAFHYVEDVDALFTHIRTWLAPSGVLVFSMEHPVITASPDGRLTSGWLVRDYFSRGRRDTPWFVNGVTKYHRTVSDVVSALARAGFVLDALLEPEPSREAVADQPSLALHLDRPALLVIKATAR